MIPVHTQLFSVSADDIDQLGHANNLVYLRWAIDAAVAHSSANGWDFERYRQFGGGWVVRAHQITYLRPAFLEDQIRVKTWIAELARATCQRRYVIERRAQDGYNTLAEASTDWVFVDFERQVPKRIPEELKKSFLILGSSPDFGEHLSEP